MPHSQTNPDLTRRGFLRHSGLGLGAAALSPLLGAKGWK